MEKLVNLSVSQQFDVERMNRAIESTIDPQPVSYTHLTLPTMIGV